jgi:hypothetical protein
MKTNRLLLFLSLTCAAAALAVDPPPDGGYPNQNTAEGEDSLFNLTTGLTRTSSARYKERVKPMDKSSGALLSLKPVIFHYKKELDTQAIPQFGLAAEDVAKVG